jgi:hypothetical protein
LAPAKRCVRVSAGVRQTQVALVGLQWARGGMTNSTMRPRVPLVNGSILASSAPLTGVTRRLGGPLLASRPGSIRASVEGAKRRLSSRFAFIRVKTTHDDGMALGDREPLWLVIEWPSSEPKPTKYALTSLPRRMSKKQIVRTFKERWRTERMYEDLKGELGLDHFEGRSFPGWHHHVSVVLCCYAFVVAERSRAFPPSAGWSRSSRPLADGQQDPLWNGLEVGRAGLDGAVGRTRA